MKDYKYEKYDYSFLYGLLTEKQKEGLQAVLDKFIGYPINKETKQAVEWAVEEWIFNNTNIKGNIKIDYE